MWSFCMLCKDCKWNKNSRASWFWRNHCFEPLSSLLLPTTESRKRDQHGGCKPGLTWKWDWFPAWTDWLTANHWKLFCFLTFWKMSFHDPTAFKSGVNEFVHWSFIWDSEEWSSLGSQIDKKHTSFEDVGWHVHWGEMLKNFEKLNACMQQWNHTELKSEQCFALTHNLSWCHWKLPKLKVNKVCRLKRFGVCAGGQRFHILHDVWWSTHLWTIAKDKFGNHRWLINLVSEGHNFSMFCTGPLGCCVPTQGARLARACVKTCECTRCLKEAVGPNPSETQRILKPQLSSTNQQTTVFVSKQKGLTKFGSLTLVLGVQWHFEVLRFFPWDLHQHLILSTQQNFNAGHEMPIAPEMLGFISFQWQTFLKKGHGYDHADQFYKLSFFVNFFVCITQVFTMKMAIFQHLSCENQDAVIFLKMSGTWQCACIVQQRKGWKVGFQVHTTFCDISAVAAPMILSHKNWNAVIFIEKHVRQDGAPVPCIID